ncbi:hypothetical protein PENTCL1PPCAC_15399, partial [Pristionchus entomophagus]
MNASQCAIFHELSVNLDYHVLIAIKSGLCLAAAIRVSKQWKSYGVRFLVHSNTKILFRFYYLLNIHYSLVFGFLFLGEFVRLRFDCFLVDFRYLLLTRCVGISSIVASHHVILVISFERLYSSFFPAHFERNSSKSLAVFLALTATISSYAYSIMKLSDDFRLFYAEILLAFPNPKIPQNQEGFDALMRTMVVSTFISLIMFLIDLRMNFFRKSSSLSSLAVSYQISENRRIVLTLLPIELTEAMLGFITSFAQLAFGKFIPNPTPIEHQMFLELSTIVQHFPLILSFIVQYSMKQSPLPSPPINMSLERLYS